MTSTCLLSFVLAATSADPGYRLVAEPAGRAHATMTFAVQCDEVVVKEWMLFAPVLPAAPGQSDVQTRMSPPGKPLVELSPLARPVLQARIPADNEKLKHHFELKVTYEARLLSRRLEPLESGEHPPLIPGLTAKQRQAALQSSGALTHDDKAFRAWLRDRKLIRAEGESEIDFARRAFLLIRRDFKYDYQPEMDRAPIAVCKAGKSDCGGLSNVLVAALRSQGIPARTLFGRWANSADPNEKLNGSPYYQYHVKAEFFAAGIGWVPVDMASGILHDRSRAGLYYFGHDPGDFLVQHIDGNLEVDSVHFGRKAIASLQRPVFWVTGSGTLDDVQINESWTVRKTTDK